MDGTIIISYFGGSNNIFAYCILVFINRTYFVLDAYVKMLMFNPTGRLIKKKKSSIKFDTENPELDETINVEVHGRTKAKNFNNIKSFIWI